MKKLMMFAAAMTIVGGAFAECGDVVVTPSNCSLVYDVKISAKTTVGKQATDKVVAGSCGDSSTISGLCYRVVGSISLKGYYTACACDCTEDFLSPTVYLWNAKAKEGGSVTWVWGDGENWDGLNVIGKKNTEVEGFFTLSDTVYGAGFGKWDANNARVTSISGNLAGYGDAPDCAENCDAAVAYPCGDSVYSSELPTAISGTWSLKYNKSLSTKLANSGITALNIPDYVTVTE